MSRIKALVMAAGLGERLRPLTNGIPKCLVRIGQRPLLDYWLESLIACGIREAVINTHAHREEMQRYIQAVNQRRGIRINESYEPRLLGTAGTITANREYLSDADQVVIVYADNFSNVDLSEMLAFHRSKQAQITMLLFRAEDPRRCGIVQLDSAGRVTRFEEKPEAPAGNLANGGVYIIESSLLSRIASMAATDLGFDVLPRLTGHIQGWIFNGYHLDIGTHSTYARAQLDAPSVLKSRGYFADGARPCVFLDRDGTLLEQVHYLKDPALVRLLPDSAAAIKRLRRHGFACVVITNQSQIGNNLLSEAELAAIHEEMYRQLTAEGAMLDAIYYCPTPGRQKDRTIVEHPDRKPGPGLLIRAAQELLLRLESSWMIGDMVSDVLAGTNANCYGSILLRTGKRLLDDELTVARRYPAANNLTEAVDRILQHRHQEAEQAQAAMRI
ncbi:MAG TPA: HAD-IIIA family hydrolase [Pyrinomonadaceae bacterium]|nr:HAD-IIIA family hydrolase [Pyrinomonadaceae bacterium]